MKIVRQYGPRDVRVEKADEPEPGPQELKIRVAWNALSVNDLQTFLSPGIRSKAWPTPLGHEFSGTIVGLGREIDEGDWPIGTNVTVDPLVSCMITNKCDACASGHRNRCSRANFIEKSGDKKGGGLAEYVTVDIQHVHKIPDGIPLEIAACVESVATAWHAVKRANFRKGDTALILGGGPTVLFILRVIRSLSPTSFILVSESSSECQTLALKHGASEVLGPLHTDFGVTGTIYKATAGFGVHVVFDTVGTQRTVDSALLCLRTGGTLVNMVAWKTNVTMNMNFLFKEITVTGAVAHDNVHPEAIEAIASGRIQGLDDLITDRIEMEDIVKKGYLTLLNEGDKHIKILVRLCDSPPPFPEEPASEPSSGGYASQRQNAHINY
ncbi:hypothetical protein Ac2012v2_007585 [Leucoagaricus gongylophorus]